MLVATFVLSVVTAALVGIAAHAPWFIGITGTTANMNVGMLLSDKSGDQVFVPVTPGKWCGASATYSTSCGDYETVSLAIYLVYAVSFLWQILAVVAAVTHAHWGVLVLGLSLAFQCAGQFGFFFRVLGLQLTVSNSLLGGVTSWQFGWASVLAAAGIIVTFFNILVFCVTFTIAPVPPPVEAPAAETEGLNEQDPNTKNDSNGNEENNNNNNSNSNNNGSNDPQQQQQQQNKNQNQSQQPPQQQQTPIQKQPQPPQQQQQSKKQQPAKK